MIFYHFDKQTFDYFKIKIFLIELRLSKSLLHEPSIIQTKISIFERSNSFSTRNRGYSLPNCCNLLLIHTYVCTGG